MTTFSLLRRNPVLSGLAVSLLLLGAMNASVYPYQSLVGIERVGLSPSAFALVLVLASAVAVTTSVLAGILSDQRANRRRMALATVSASVAGAGLMGLAPGPVTFVLCNGVLLPIGSSLYGQLFALSRLATGAIPDHRDAVQSTIRAAMSLSFLAMLIFWTYAFSAGADVMSIYVSGGLAAVGLTLVLLRVWPRDGATDWADAPSGLNLTQAFAEIARPAIMLRLLCLGAISSAGLVYMVLISLVFDASPLRGASDVALYVGLVAAWEVPFMLFLPRHLARVPRSWLLAAGTLLYATHLVLIPVLSESALLWVLTPIAGLGGTAIITLPIVYYQDLMVGRPGTAGALLALQRLVGDVMAAGSFAVGMMLGGHGLTAALGGAVSVAGAFGLLLADRNGGIVPDSAKPPRRP